MHLIIELAKVMWMIAIAAFMLWVVAYVLIDIYLEWTQETPE